MQNDAVGLESARRSPRALNIEESAGKQIHLKNLEDVSEHFVMRSIWGHLLNKIQFYRLLTPVQFILATQPMSKNSWSFLTPVQAICGYSQRVIKVMIVVCILRSFAYFNQDRQRVYR